MQKAKIYQVAQTPTVEDIIESACGEGAKQVIQGDLVLGWFVFQKQDFWKKIVWGITDAAVCFPPASCPSVLDSSCDNLDDFVGKVDMYYDI